MRIALAGLLLVVVSGCDCGPNISSARGDLQVVPLALDFGNRSPGSMNDLTLELTNTGNAPLSLTNATLEGDTRQAFMVGMLPPTLEAGASFTLNVRYRAPMTEGADGATLLIESNASTSPQVRVSILGRSLRIFIDAGRPDAGTPDAGETDAGEADAGTPDAGEPDAGEPDAGTPDAGVRDAGFFDPDAGPDDAGCYPRIPTGTSSVTYQVDIAHTGAQPNDLLRLPLCRRWSRDLGGAAGYPVVADGRVYVVSHTNQAGYGNLLWALDQFTGAVVWGPVDLGGTYWWAAAAYDNGRVFAINASGFMTTVDAASGAVLWARQVPGQYSCDSAPTAANGLVYTGAAGSGGTVYALNAGDGGVRWTMPVANGNTSSPAVTPNGVFVSYACNQAWGFNPSTGAQLWHHSGACSGGGGKNVAAYQGRIFTRDFMGNLMLGATTGLELGTYSSRFIPAFSGDVAFTTPGTSVRALRLDGGSIAWTFDAGTETINTAPIVVGPHVIVASGQHLFAVNVIDGSLASSFAVSGVRTPDEQNVSNPLAGFAAADGMLFVPVGNGVEAY
ncbi:MAG: PQQ-binding-like beta-propeller repeat protein [Archangium sp.]